MLGGVGVDDHQPGVEVVDQDDAGLPPGQRRPDPLDVLGRRDLPLQLDVDRVGQRLAVGHQDGRGQRVVLGLADQVGGDVHRVGRVVGQDRDLGRAGLGVDADQALERALGRGDVDVARPGDQVDRRAEQLAGSPAPRSRARRRRTSRSPARRRRRRPRRRRAARRRPGSSGAAGRRTPVGLSRCGGEATASDVDAGLLGRARRSSRRCSGRPPGRRGRRARPARTGTQRSVTVPPGTTWVVTSARRWSRCTSRARRIDSSSAARTAGSRPAERGRQGRGRHPQVDRPDAVEPLAEVAQRTGAARADLLADRLDRRQRGLDVEIGPRQDRAQVGRVQGLAAQVDPDAGRSRRQV